MSKRDPTEEALNALSELRRNPGPGPFVRQLASFLGHRSNLVIAKAAKTAGELRATELIPDLAAAFHRLMANPAKLDKGCAAVTAIAGALYSMDYESPDVYLKGARHVQMEASFGPSVDAAAQLRGDSALGLVRTRHPDALFEVVRLLADKEPRVRMGAARALGTVVGETGELLLLLKALSGDGEPDVLAECFSGMLASGTDRSLSFVASYLDHEDEAIAEAAALSLGASRLPRAIDALREKWGRTVQGSMRKTLLLALATARQDAAFEFLLSQVAGGDPRTAVDVIQALRTYRNDERMRKALAEAVERRGDRQVTAAFHAEFPRGG
jgi:HEAT repeat protein